MAAAEERAERRRRMGSAEADVIELTATAQDKGTEIMPPQNIYLETINHPTSSQPHQSGNEFPIVVIGRCRRRTDTN